MALTSSIRTEILAAACHSAWYAYTVLALKESGEPWSKAPDWQKDSMRDGIQFWDDLLNDKTYEDLSDTGALVHLLAPASHENWMKHKLATGWKYGEEKDPGAKTHPCLVSYGTLPEAQKRKDAVVIHAYLAARTAGGGVL